MLTSRQVFLRLATLRWLGVFVCALATLLAMTGTASALEPAQTKTSVWGFDFAEHNSVGLFRTATLGKHQGNCSARAEAASDSLLAARAGVTAAQTIGRGLVSPGGKLGQLLPALESQFGAAAPKNALQALNVVGQATKSVGLESGYVVSQAGGKIVLQNAGGVVTTLGSEGSILVQRGSDVLLHLIP